MKNSDFKVIFSKDFEMQLSNLSFYIGYKLSNPNSARKIIHKLVDSANSLSNFPERHPVVETRKRTEDIIRKFIVNQYTITYYVDYKEKTVHINNLLTSK